MLRLEYKDRMVTVQELAEMSGIAEPTIRDRLRRGYSTEQAVREIAVNDGVQAFCDASWYKDWIGISTDQLHSMYWKWCLDAHYQPLTKQGFMRHILKIYPTLKTVPTKRENRCVRIIREK